jgi:tetratricopeptide (TPR) repeat protein
MNCETLDNLLLDLLYDEVEGDDKIQAQAHLNSCEGCQQKFAGMGGVRQVFQAMPEPELPALSYQALLAEANTAAKKYAQGLASPNKKETESFWAKLSATMRFLWSPPVAVAAGVVLVLGVSLSLNNAQLSPTSPKATMTLGDEAPMLAQTLKASPEPELEMAEAPTLPPGDSRAGEAGVLSDGIAASKKDRSAISEAKPIATPAVVPMITAPTAKPKAILEGNNVEDSKRLSPLDSITADAPNISSGGLALSQGKGDDAGYKQSIIDGDNAYKLGDFQEAEKQYQTAVDKALDGSKDQDIALAAQAQTQAASKDCDDALESARKITAQSKGTALLAVADCYTSVGDTTKAKNLYSEVSSFGGAPGAEAKRSLLALETKLSKSELEETKANKSPKSPVKTTKKPPVAEPPRSNK